MLLLLWFVPTKLNVIIIAVVPNSCSLFRILSQSLTSTRFLTINASSVRSIYVKINQMRATLNPTNAQIFYCFYANNLLCNFEYLRVNFVCFIRTLFFIFRFFSQIITFFLHVCRRVFANIIMFALWISAACEINNRDRIVPENQKCPPKKKIHNTQTHKKS